MIKFVQKLDRNNKIYIAKPLRETGLTNRIEIVPNGKAAVIYQAGTPVDDILASLKIIVADLKHWSKKGETKAEPRGSIRDQHNRTNQKQNDVTDLNER
jgi:hypothetical protein